MPRPLAPLLRRLTFSLAALVAGGAHAPIIGPHLREAPYMGVLFIAFTAACFVLAGLMLVTDGRLVPALGLATCWSGVVAYIVSRTIALPQLADDVGDWANPLGIVSVVSESIAGLAALLVLLDTARS